MLNNKLNRQCNLDKLNNSSEHPLIQKYYDWQKDSASSENTSNSDDFLDLDSIMENIDNRYKILDEISAEITYQQEISPNKVEKDEQRLVSFLLKVEPSRLLDDKKMLNTFKRMNDSSQIADTLITSATDYQFIRKADEFFGSEKLSRNMVVDTIVEIGKKSPKLQNLSLSACSSILLSSDKLTDKTKITDIATDFISSNSDDADLLQSAELILKSAEKMANVSSKIHPDNPLSTNLQKSVNALKKTININKSKNNPNIGYIMRMSKGNSIK